MTVTELKQHLTGLEQLAFQLPNGKMVPAHFHLTEIGLVTRHFMDCGGTLRSTNTVNLQLWYDQDIDHRLSSEKFIRIIEQSEGVLNLANHQVEVEYQGKTIEKYGLNIKNGIFQLEPTFTDCLAKESCGIPESTTSTSTQSACAPGSGCC